MSGEINLTGNWVGEYFQHGRPRPIVATLVQMGDALTGTMKDGEPEHRLSVGEVATESGADERIVAAVHKIFPDAPADSIQYYSKLPPESFLEGWARGRGIYFDKSYKGTCYGGYKVGDHDIGTSYDNHVVHYSGRCSTEGEEIEGRWWIDPRQDLGGRKAEGSFVLRRWKDDPPR